MFNNSKIDFIFHKFHGIQCNFIIQPNNLLEQLFLKGNLIVNSSVVVRKSIIVNLNGFDTNPKLVSAEDYDLWLRLRKADKRFFNCKEILVKHRIHNASAFNSKGNDNKVDDLLVSHGFKSRAEKNNDPTKIRIPQINKINMKLL